MSQKKTSGKRKKSGTSTRTKTTRTRTSSVSPTIQREIGLWAVVLVLVLVTLGIYLKATMGAAGVFLNSFFVGLFGFSAYVITLYSLVIAFLGLFDKLNRSLWIKLIVGYGILLLLSALLHTLNGSALTTAKMMYKEASIRTGGLVGGLLGGGLMKVIGKTGAIIVVIFVLLILIILLTERSAVQGMRIAGRKTKEESEKVRQFAEERRARQQLKMEERKAYQAQLREQKEKEAQEKVKEAAEAPAVDTGKVKPKKTAFLTLSEPTSRGDRQVKLAPQEEEDPSPIGKKFRQAAKNASKEPEIETPTQPTTIIRYHDGAVDIPLIANDKYLERKRKIDEEAQETAREIISGETEVRIVINEPEPAKKDAGIEKDEGRLVGDGKTTSGRSSGRTAQRSEESTAGSARQGKSNAATSRGQQTELDEEWGYLFHEAEAAGKAEAQENADAALRKEDFSGISTEKAFGKDEFPTGYEERNETANKNTKDAEPVVAVKKPGPTGKYVFPPIDLLRENKNEGSSTSREELLKSAKSLEDVLLTFGVEAKVIQVNKGPAVTRYELQPKQGVKVSRIVNLTDDIAMNLAASSIRIEAPIPGKSAVGIEIPNKETSMVTLREVLDSPKFQKAPSKLTFGLGKDIDGEVQVADIARMPHMLIAGATGSGKSVCINSMIISILYKADPNDVKLILIDPKVVELSVYNGIPHLLLPVVNDPKQASATLNWAVQEMTRRFKKFAEMNVRDIKGYNALIEEQKDETKQKMPQIVIIIDELADLMMTASKEVEASIVRLTQLARAAGMHLVIATQRPSVDVITGLIKANTPSRIAFAVSSGIDSRTILDGVGAENLLGRGDMLYAPFGSSKPVRIQGTFVSDKEVEDVVAFVKEHAGGVEYSTEVMNNVSRSGDDSSGIEDEIDEYLEDAIKFVVDKQKASISMLQRAFRIGFNRAARLMDALYARGVVGEDEGSKPRQVLMTKEEWENQNS